MDSRDIEIGFKNLSHDQARALINYHQELIERERAAAAPINRRADFERTASELVGNAGHVTAPIAAPAAGAAPYQVDSSPNVPPPPPPPPAAPSPVGAPVAAPSPAVSVPGGAPTTGHSTAANTDTRGVPFDERFHSGTAAKPGRNENGSWKKRRGHDAEALKAYEAPYLAGNRVGARILAVLAPNGGTPASTAPSPVGGGQPAPAASAMMGAHPDPNYPASWPPAPPPPPPPAGPSFDEFARLWTQLCAAQRVTVELENWIKTTYGGHPMLSDVFRNNHIARAQVYGELLKYETPAQAA